MTGLLSVAGSTPSDTGFELKSVRFNDGDSAYLSRTQIAGNRKTWTWSCWAKRCKLAATLDIFGTPSEGDGLRWYGAASNLNFSLLGSGGGWLITDAEYRDVAAWYHIVVAFDTTQAQSDLRVKLYVNGVQETDFSSETYPAQNSEFKINQSGQVLSIGRGHANDYLDGYLAEVYFIDGEALGPEYFGETNVTTNQWQPINPTDIKPTVTFGVNGFYLPFSNDALATSFTDSALGHPIDVNGDVHTDTSIKKIGTASAQFDGTGDYLMVGNSSSFHFGSGDFTIEFWVYQNASGGMIMAGDAAFQFYISSGTLAMYCGTASGTYDLVDDADFFGTLANNTWQHIAFVRSGATFYGFVDGTAVTTVIVDIDPTQAFTDPVGIGEHSDEGGSYVWNGGYLDEIRMSNIARYTGTFTPSTTAFTTDDNTLLLMHMDGANDGVVFTDSSNYPGRNTITAVGDTKNVRVSNHPVAANGDAHIIGPKIGSSAIAFDGDEDYLSVPDSADWDFNSGDFTIDFWANAATTAWEDDAFFWIQYVDGNDYAGMRIRTNGWVNILVRISDSTLINLDFDEVTMPVQEWFHFACVRDTSQGKFLIFINGILQQSLSNTTDWPDITAAFRIGDDNYNSDQEFTGYMDEFRVSKGIARWTANFTPPTSEYASDAYTKLLIHSNTTMGSTTFIDSSGSAHTILAVGDIMHVAPKIGVGMGAFDGTDDYLTVPSSIDFGFGTSDFTLECWINIKSLAVTSVWIFGGSVSNNLDFAYIHPNTRFDVYLDEVEHNFSSWTASLNTWYHVALCRNGTDLRCFVDGTQIGSTSSSSNVIPTTGVYIGSQYNSSYELNGYMDEVRISNSARYTSGFTPSTTAFKDDKDTVLLLHMDGGGGINPDTNLPTLPGQGTYFWDASTDAIFYDSAGVPTNKSIMSFPGSSSYLSVPPSSDWVLGSGEWTVENWVYNTAVTNSAVISWSQRNDAAASPLDDTMQIWGETASGTTTVTWQFRNSSSGNETIVHQNTFPMGKWTHIAAVRVSNTVTLYLDGVASNTTYAASGQEMGLNRVAKIGTQDSDVTYDIEGYMDQFRLSNSARYTSGFTPSTTPFTTDSNTKLLIQSDFSEGGLGADHSGNYNAYGLTNLIASDMMLDSPMNNFCTFNSLSAGAAGTKGANIALSNGDLQILTTYAGWEEVAATQYVSSGKWYAECCVIGNYLMMGVVASRHAMPQWTDLATDTPYGWALYLMSTTNSVYHNGSNSADAAGGFTSGDIWSLVLDLDATPPTLTWYRNNVSTRTTDGLTSYELTAGLEYTFYQRMVASSSSPDIVWNFGQDSSFAGQKTAQGNQDENDKGDFFFAPPAGYLALCTDNMAAPSIAKPNTNFNTITWTGDGTASRAFTGVNFAPGLVWAKQRTGAISGQIYDYVRGTGASKELTPSGNSNQGAGNADDYGYLSAFDSDGFTAVDGASSPNYYFNENTKTYAAWNWKAGGSTTVTNTDGSIDSEVSANSGAGFSIISYDGVDTAGTTVGHGLSQAPELLIVRSINTNSRDWEVGSSVALTGNGTFGWTKYLEMNATFAPPSASTIRWNDTAPTASVFSLGTTAQVNGSGENYIAYAFHSVEGYCKVAYYEGNGAAHIFVPCGFRPAWVMIKNLYTTHNWYMYDDKINLFNPADNYLEANTADAETVGSGGLANGIDFVSNGFTVWATGSEINDNVRNHMFLAFAESPFKTANAR